MNSQLIGSFGEAVVQILSQFGIQHFKKGNVALFKHTVTAQQVTVLVGFTKGFSGNVAYSMCQDTACTLASKMMMGMPVETLDDMAQSAISELANMISGHAAGTVSAGGMMIDIAPPSLIIGDNVQVNAGQSPTVLVEIGTDAGRIDLYIAIQEKAA